MLARDRGRGLGGALVGALRDRALADGAERVIVHSRPRSVGLYRQAGFGTVPELMEITEPERSE